MTSRKETTIPDGSVESSDGYPEVDDACQTPEAREPDDNAAVDIGHGLQQRKCIP